MNKRLSLIFILLLFTGVIRAQDNVTLTMWVFGEGEDTFGPDLEAAFEAEHPNIDLTLTMYPEDQYVTVIDTALAAGAPPDLAFIYERRWLAAGHFLPLDDAIAANNLDLTNYNAGAMSACVYEGQVYCLGTYAGAVVLFYNKDVFDTAGVAYPSSSEPMTIAEYGELARSLHQPNQDFTQQVWGGFATTPHWWTDPRNFFSEDGLTTEGIANSETVASALDVMTGLVLDGIAPSADTFEALGGSDLDLFAQGKLAMIFSDNFQMTYLNEFGLNYGIAPVPVPEGQEGWVATWTDGFGVFAASAHPEEAKQFLIFSATEGNRMRAEQGSLPLNTMLAEEINWAEGDETRQQLLDVMALARPSVFVPNFWDVAGLIDDAFGFVVDEGMSPQDALNEVAPEMQQRLNEGWETWSLLTSSQ